LPIAGGRKKEVAIAEPAAATAPKQAAVAAKPARPKIVADRRQAALRPGES
jgi:hypothetical protein